MINKLPRHIVHALLSVTGIVLMTGGIITGKHGATVAGICVTAVNVQQWVQWNKKHKNSNNNS